MHSQGPGFYDEAGKAYDELFRSEIFTWEESLSEAQRIERYFEVDSSDDEIEDVLTPVFSAPNTGLDGSPSSLPQILYLAYKNHGQFLLDRLKDQLSRIEGHILSGSSLIPSAEATEVASKCLKLFVEATDRDDSDLELWRLISRVSHSLQSRRIARFCLEAVLEADENDFTEWTEPLGLEEGFAIEQLKPLLQSLDDQLSQSQLLPMLGNPKAIITSFTKYIDPCPYLPISLASLEDGSSRSKPAVRPIEVPLRSWASCGKAILLRLGQEAQGIIESDPGASYSLILPSTQSKIVLFSSEAVNGGEVQPQLLGSALSDQVEDGQKTAMAPNDGMARMALAEPIALSGNEVQSLTGNPLESPTKIEETPGHEITEGAVVDVTTGQADHTGSSTGQHGPLALPTRKRSSETADLPDSNDVGRSKSKRIKARESFDPSSLKDSTAEDWAKWYEQQLQMYLGADDAVFNSIGSIQSKLGAPTSISLSKLREIVSNQPSNDVHDDTYNPPSSLNLVAQDLRCTLDSWDIGKSKAFLNGHDPTKDPAGGSGGGLNTDFPAFLEHSDQESRVASQKPILPDDHDLDRFVHSTDQQPWNSLDQLSYQWLDMLLSFHLPNRLGKGSHRPPDLEIHTLYESHRWPDSLKEGVVQMLVFQDLAVYSEINRLVQSTEHHDRNTKEHMRGLTPLQDSSSQNGNNKRRLLHPDVLLSSKDTDETKRMHTCLVQAIFELHLDVYGRITNPRSQVDESIRIVQRDRLRRWSALASKLMNQWSWPGYRIGEWTRSSDDLYIRFVWASVVCNNLLEPCSRDYTILCYKDLIGLLEKLASERPSTNPLVIELPNNAIMPEISVEAAEREISRLTTMDFFMGIFNSESTDPITLVENLEPLLDLSVNYHKRLSQHGADGPTSITGDSPSRRAADDNIDVEPDPKLVEAMQFLERGSLPLRLILWQKLRDAYRAVAYPPQVLLCDLRMMALIIDHLGSSSHKDASPDNRRDNLLRWLHRLDDHITRLLSIALSNPDPFECIDNEQVLTAMETLTSLQRILHVFALWEDTIRVGKTPTPVQVNQNAARGLAKSTDKFRDMIVKIWTLQYLILKEAMTQNTRMFDSQEQHLISHLERVHQALGLRCYCSLANKAFLKLMRKELENFKLTSDWDTDMAQLVYDLYGVKTSPNALEMQDHGCLPENLDRSTAIEIMDLVIAQVQRISTKDLLKSDLKFTVDKMQQVIMIPKITNSVTRTFNNRLVNTYLKSPINPQVLRQSLKGIGALCGSVAVDEGSGIASKGWYFMLGQIALAKFRSSKRSSAASTDDLSIARTFLRHDLEFNTERWETWYRLGQVYDTLIEEDTTWTADKLDNHMDDLAELQRKAIHCYSMAIAVAMRYAEGSFEDINKMADLYADFGTRIYASTREPFCLKAFSLDDYKRHYNSAVAGMYQNAPFRGMQLYQAWRFASILLRQASVQKPKNWMYVTRQSCLKMLTNSLSSTYFTYGKVLWKMYNCSDEVRGSAKLISHQPVIDAFVKAIEACPEKRDSKHPDKDPILEPHYKLVSIVHKLVRSTRITVNSRSFLWVKLAE